MDGRTVDKSSRRVDEKVDLKTREDGSGRTRPRASFASARITSVPSRYSRGGLWRPVLLSGPSAVQFGYSAVISWTLDPAEPAGYHRTRHRLVGAEDWIVGAWSGSASWTAEVTIPDLEVGNYEYQIESADGDHKLWTTGFLPATPGTFEIESLFTLIISNVHWTIGKTTLGVLYDTNAATKCIISWKKATEPLWNQTNFTTSFHAGGHSHTLSGLTTYTVYWIRIRVYDAASNEDWAPSETGYYLVRTHSSSGTGGGYVGIVT